jgi:hypothetical protein
MFSKQSSQSSIFGPKRSVFDPPVSQDSFVMNKIIEKMGQGAMILSTEEEPPAYLSPNQRGKKFKKPLQDSGSFIQPPGDMMNIIKNLPSMKNIMSNGSAAAAQSETRTDFARV